MAEPVAGLEALRGLHAGGAGLLADARVWTAAAAGVVAALAIAALARRGPARRWTLRREALAALRQTGALPPQEAVSAQALLLRRIAVTVAGEAAAREAGEAWLARLDAIFRTDFFSRGDGRCFGDALYASAPRDAVALREALARLIARLDWRG